MAEIGPSLREARMRARIDVTEAEADTKIRGKYLRALENEEWDLLPGPTFVKSFLRTYGDYLGLDGRMLVEEFKLRYERPELQPITPLRASSRDRERRDRRGGSRDHGRRGNGPPSAGRGRAVLIGALVFALLVGLFLLGRNGPCGKRGDSSKTATSTVATQRTTSTSAPTTTTTSKAPPLSSASLRIVPSGLVYVCLRAGTRTLIAGQNLQPGSPTRTFKAKRFLLMLGNSDARLFVNGRTRSVPASASGIAYEITATGAKRLSVAQGPAC